jgi:hypothetical protein
MSRRRRTTTTASALVASLALLATLPALCGCLPEPVAAGEHACCAPPPGLRTEGCCAFPEVKPDPATAAPAARAAVAPVLVVAWVAPLVTPVHDRVRASPAPAASPPLTVRRL